MKGDDLQHDQLGSLCQVTYVFQARAWDAFDAADSVEQHCERLGISKIQVVAICAVPVRRSFFEWLLRKPPFYEVNFVFERNQQ